MLMNMLFVFRKLVTVILLFSLAPLTIAQNKEYPPRLKRSDSFFGIHFDFHAGHDCTEIGKDVNREMIDFIIDQVKPDYVQCDCKGHAGITSYPTKVGNPAPGFVRDPLKIWREVTAERGVALYLHYSGVWDSEAVKKHPEWARINEKGEKDDRLTSVYGPYADELLIPQLKEIIDNYGVDGVWIDGECWATERDYNEKVIQAFQQKTGIQDIPRTSEDPYWFEFSEFCRDGFRDYIKHYITELHNYNPQFQIASNWAFSSFMPEPVSVDVDFISGDYSPQNSVNTARLEGRCMVYQGKPWDLMAWSFVWKDRVAATKTVPQLQQEAAMVLALGGGFQAYFRQKRDGSIRKWQMNTMSKVAQFCRERQEICHKAEPVPQIGLIHSSKAFYKNNRKLFSPSNNILDPMKGILYNLLDSQNVVDIVMEHHLEGRFEEYPLLIYPEWDYIEPSFKEKCLDYVTNGGNLLIIGPEAAALFAQELGVKLIGEPTEQINGLEFNERLSNFKSTFQKAKLEQGTKSFGKIFTNNDIFGSPEIAASIRSFGKGKIAATYLNLGKSYNSGATSDSRDFLNALVRELFPKPIVEVKGSHYVDVTLNRKNNKLAVNLINTGGPHANDNTFTFNEIPEVGPLNITIKTEREPQKITLEPEGKELAYQYKNGQISLTLPSLKIHNIIAVE